MGNQIFHSELKILEILWSKGDMRAKDLAVELEHSTKWHKATTYTIIRTCMKKGLIERVGIDFICRPLISKEEAQKQEVDILVEKMFNGSLDLLIALLLNHSKITPCQVDGLRELLQKSIY